MRYDGWKPLVVTGVLWNALSRSPSFQVFPIYLAPIAERLPGYSKRSPGHCASLTSHVAQALVDIASDLSPPLAILARIMFLHRPEGRVSTHAAVRPISAGLRSIDAGASLFALRMTKTFAAALRADDRTVKELFDDREAELRHKDGEDGCNDHLDDETKDSISIH
jgi:hypothetical protein